MSDADKQDQTSLIPSNNKGLIIPSTNLIRRGISHLEKRERKTICFPETHSLGKLYIIKDQDWDSWLNTCLGDLRFDYEEWHFDSDNWAAHSEQVVAAEGQIRLTSNQRLLLELSLAHENEDSALELLHPLTKLERNTLKGLFIDASYYLETQKPSVFSDDSLELKEQIMKWGEDYFYWELKRELNQPDWDIFDFIVGLTELEWLGLYSCRYLFKDGVNALNRLKKLQWLELRHNRITDEQFSGLSEMENLQRLMLDDDQGVITCKSLVYLKHLTHLREVGLYMCDLADDSLRHLEKLTALKQLYIPSSKITGYGLRFLNAFGLERLDLSYSSLNDVDGLDFLNAFEKLEWLDIHRNNLSFQSLKSLKTLRRLRTLIISKDSISEGELKELCAFLPEHCEVRLS